MENTNQYQSLEWAMPKMERRLEANKKRGMKLTLSGSFSFLRKERHLSLMGDYGILWSIVVLFRKLHVSFNMEQLKNAMKKSLEYRSLGKKDKMAWATMLFSCE